jgi:small subunit ribosomal protein S4e
MAHKKSAHMSRLAAPKSWPVLRKNAKWIIKPDPGAQPLKMGMSVSTFLTEVLGIARNKAEAKGILNQNLVSVNGKVVRETNFIVGLFDTLKIARYNKTFRVLLDELGRLKLVEIPESEASVIPIRVEGKTTVKGNKLQINLSGGRNFLSDKDSYKIDDVLIFNTKDKKTIKHLKLQKGSLVYIIGGKHSGKLSTVKDFVQEGLLRKKKFVVASDKEERIKVPIKDVFVLGEDKPEISMGEK